MFDNPQLDFWFRGLFVPAMLLPATLATRLIAPLSSGLTQPSLLKARTVILIAVGAGLAALPFTIPLLQRLLLLPVAAILLALALIDWQQRLLPDRLTQPLLWAGLLVNQQGYFVSLTEAVTGACAGYLSLWLLNAAYRRRRKTDGIGQGDFKLLAALGCLDRLGRAAYAGHRCRDCRTVRFGNGRFTAQIRQAGYAALWPLSGAIRLAGSAVDRRYWHFTLQRRNHAISSNFTLMPTGPAVMSLL